MTDLPYPPYQDLMTLAQHLSLSQDVVRRLVKRGRLPLPTRIEPDGTEIWCWATVCEFVEDPNRGEPEGLVYVIGFGDYVKIGFTTNLNNRLPVLQTGMPEKLTLYGTIADAEQADERRLHRRFAAHRLQGEWFRKEGELAAWIEAGCPK